MSYKEVVDEFLRKVMAIKAERPKYRLTGYGADGTCDCIGLVIGAIRRMKLKYSGIHGTNWATRREVDTLKTVESLSD